MPSGPRKTSIDYYDAIAEHYDSKMGDDQTHRTRLRISEYFVNIPYIQRILDMGAGTGADLEWQLAAGYRVVFFEPSAKMAAVANKKHRLESHDQIEPLIGEQATYDGLKKYESIGLDAVFSNFAAINSIGDLGELFQVISKILKPGGSVVCVLYDRTGRMDRLKSFLRANVRTKTIRVALDDTSQHMTVYLHSRHQLLSAARKNHFELLNGVDLNWSGFKLFHFIKK